MKYFPTFIYFITVFPTAISFNVKSVYKSFQIRQSTIKDYAALQEAPTLSTTEVISSFFFKLPKTDPVPSTSITDIKNVGNELLRKLKLPESKSEAWRHTNLRKLFGLNFGDVPEVHDINKQAIKSSIDQNCEHSCLVFVDGIYSTILSDTSKVPSGIALHRLSNIQDHKLQSIYQQASVSHIPDLKELERNSYGSDILSAMSMANANDLSIIDVAAEVDSEYPLQLLFLSTLPSSSSSSPPTISYPRVLIKAGENSKLSIKQSYASIATETSNQLTLLTSSNENANITMNIAQTQLFLEKGSTIQHTYLQELDVPARHVEVITADVKSNARYDVTVVQSGAAMSRVNLHINLTETNANATVFGLNLCPSHQLSDIHSNIQHSQRDTHSEQVQRNVIADGGEAVFKGRIRMPKIAQKSSSSQVCRTLLLGTTARLQAMPVLEIQADDVTCSHGAAVADLDENSMFYLATRGIDRMEARKLLLSSFVLEMLGNTVMDKLSTDRIIAVVEKLNPPKDQDSGATRGSMPYMSL